MRVAIIVAGVGLAFAQVGCVGVGSSCTESRLKAYDVPLPTDSAMQFALDRCSVDPEVCVDVCTLAMQREQQSFQDVTQCKVTYEDTRVVALAGYEVFVGGGFCGLAGDDIGPPPPRGGDPDF